MVNAEPNRCPYRNEIDGLRRNLIRNMTAFSSNTDQVDWAVGSFANQANKATATTDFWGEYRLDK